MTWAVDRHRPGVAYVDANNAARVFDTGVPATPPQLGTSSINDVASHRTPGHGLHGYLWLSRSVSGWQLTITHGWTGRVVHQRSGGPARESVAVQWDRNLTPGEPARNGPHPWTLTATADGGTAPVPIGSGNFPVACGTFPFRGYDCYGGPGCSGSSRPARATGTAPARTALPLAGSTTPAGRTPGA
ncbi:hypothetical protein [Micromonospora sp. CPCC 205561]|uniref:hypothetical protein n=1 Tax=Micromonospora sp. CPCC 205561 TaxID=3122407 RepID=UPI002FF2321D